MSGPLGSSQWMYSTGGGLYPYEIGQSLRFNDDDSAYLSRTPASAGNRKTWTWSGWVKRGNLGTQELLNAYQDANNQTLIAFSSDVLIVYTIHGGGALDYGFQTSGVFRDPSAWYHIVAAFNSINATAADRAVVYVNGVRQAGSMAFGDIPLNQDGIVNSTNAHSIGRRGGGTNYFDGYMAEVNFIDGSALDPTSFGEFKSGIWVPKEYTGSYGTNGFYLPFSDSAAIGDDLSGNANDWTPSGLASTDVMLDSPTNNYAVLNPLDKNGGTLAEGNLRYTGTYASGTSINGHMARSTLRVPPSGKWYAEASAFIVAGSGNSCMLGFTSSNQPPTVSAFSSTLNPWIGVDASVFNNSVRLSWDGVSASLADNTTLFASMASGDIINFAVDFASGEIWVGKNGTYYNSGDPAAGTNPTATFTVGDVDWAFIGEYVAASTDVNRSGVDANFGQSPFAYTPPSDFLALNTANLPAPAIDPAVDDVPADYFNTVLYTGTGAALSVTGVGFQPDWTWIKGRSGATDHALYDAVRGVQEQLESNQTGAETTEATGLTAFGADGFSVGALAQLNTSTATYVAWNWLAGNGTSSNTDGTITSTVSVNQKAGFSIVSYTGTGANATVGHGLGAAPSMVIVKNRDQADDWQVYHGANTANPETDYLVLNTTAATADAADRWNDTLPTATVFSIGTGVAVNTNTEDYIAYCFAEIEGFSKFGSYTGNGSADGPFVYLPFRPAFIITKRTDNSFGGDWYMWDDERQTYNVMGPRVVANGSGAEGLGTDLDLLSNGFKLRSSAANFNASGGTYIFAAFAEAPFKYSNAR